MQHFVENELIKSIVLIATERDVNTQHTLCKRCHLYGSIANTCAKCMFCPPKHNIEKTNLDQVNKVLSRLRNK